MSVGQESLHNGTSARDDSSSLRTPETAQISVVTTIPIPSFPRLVQCLRMGQVQKSGVAMQPGSASVTCRDGQITQRERCQPHFSVHTPCGSCAVIIFSSYGIRWHRSLRVRSSLFSRVLASKPRRLVPSTDRCGKKHGAGLTALGLPQELEREGETSRDNHSLPSFGASSQ